MWAPKGVEVFLRPPFPCASPIKEERTTEDVDGAMSGEFCVRLDAKPMSRAGLMLRNIVSISLCMHAPHRGTVVGDHG